MEGVGGLAMDGDLAPAKDPVVQGQSGPVLQRVVLDRSAALRPLYWRGLRGGSPSLDAVRLDDGGLLIQPGATCAFDTYFNAVFEQHWRLHTRVRTLSLRLELRGRATLRIWRRTLHGDAALLHEAEAAGAVEVALPDDAPHFRQAGLVWFELTAGGGPVLLLRGTWSTPGATPAPVGLAVAICTFNREAALGRLLDTIAGDPALDGPVARIIVVNQGRPGLIGHLAIASAAARLRSRLRVVEQGNLGGAGGFGRGVLEAMDDAACTHIALLDDDVRLEPESLARMAAFFALADGPVCLGGHMLDSLRPMQLYEAGARIRHNWTLAPLEHDQDLSDPDALASLLDFKPMHFNGWWCFGVPKAVVAEHGMMLPCFIRGDDVEYGLRLHDRGVPTTGLPGVGIWHEPFYVKLGGWQLYYETRNALICAALHGNFGRTHVAVQVTKRLLGHLLTYRYYGAALVVRATEDFLRGPAILDGDPRPLHASLGALRAADPECWTPRERVLPDARVGASPRWAVGFALRLMWLAVANWLRPTRPDAPLQRLFAHDFVWFRVGAADALAVETYWDRELPTFRRDRARYRTLLASGLRAVAALHRRAPELRAAWRREAPRLTSVPFWRAYVRQAED